MLLCSQAYLEELVELHKRLMTLREGHILQQVCLMGFNNVSYQQKQHVQIILLGDGELQQPKLQ